LQTAARPQKDNDKMLTKRQQQVLKAMVDGGNGDKYPNGSFANGLWWAGKEGEYITFGASSLYALAHHGLIAFVDAYTVSPTPKGEALAALLDETTMVTRRGVGVVIS